MTMNRDGTNAIDTSPSDEIGCAKVAQVLRKAKQKGRLELAALIVDFHRSRGLDLTQVATETALDLRL